VGNVVLETVGLLVALVAIGFGTFERFAQEQTTCRSGKSGAGFVARS
jgi:hypothetical protein